MKLWSYVKMKNMLGFILPKIKASTIKKKLIFWVGILQMRNFERRQVLLLGQTQRFIDYHADIDVRRWWFTWPWWITDKTDKVHHRSLCWWSYCACSPASQQPVQIRDWPDGPLIVICNCCLTWWTTHCHLLLLLLALWFCHHVVLKLPVRGTGVYFPLIT